MAYVQPRIELSSIVIKGGTDSPYSDEYVFRHVDIDLIMNDPDVRPNLLDAITRAFRELGIECLGGGDNKHPLAIEIRDEDIDKVVDLNIELEAGEILDVRNVSCDPSLSDGIIVEIDDDNFDSKTLIDSAITIDATDFLDESDCLSFLREYADYMPKSFELTGSVNIEGFEEID